MVQPPVVVVPGITASVLEDWYPVEPEELWSAVIHRNHERITLHPDDLRFEAIEPARVVARNPFKVAYIDLVEALRHDLSKQKDKPTPVFAFGYDWRRDCFDSAHRLEAMIEEVIGRSCLLPHYRKTPPDRVDLVAHSMGGVIVAAYLRGKQTGEFGFTRGMGRVRRIVTMGTPFRGSVDAIHKVTTGMGSLTGSEPRDREREAARMMPALYQLLPSFPGAATSSDGDQSVTGQAVDLFDVANWQPSVLQTMRQFIKLVGADKEPLALLSQFLRDAKVFIDAVNSLDLSDPAMLPEGVDGWLPIVGLDAPTLQGVAIRRQGGNPRFELKRPVNEGPNSKDTGDGTVPFRGSVPMFLSPDRLVCVTPDDLSFWELADKALVKLAGFHSMLPRINLVQRLTIRHLRNDFQGEFVGHPAPNVEKPSWQTWIKKKTST